MIYLEPQVYLFTDHWSFDSLDVYNPDASYCPFLLGCQGYVMIFVLDELCLECVFSAVQGHDVLPPALKMKIFRLPSHFSSPFNFGSF